MRPDLYPRECGAIATHRVPEGSGHAYFCELHLNISMERVTLCNLCERPTDFQVVMALHQFQCHYIAQGVDCYHFEGDVFCDCVAQYSFASDHERECYYCQTPSVGYGADTEPFVCVDCASSKAAL
jgi:hypothetical protein